MQSMMMTGASRKKSARLVTPGARVMEKLRTRSLILFKIAPELYEASECAYRYLEHLVKPWERVQRHHLLQVAKKEPGEVTVVTAQG